MATQRATRRWLRHRLALRRRRWGVGGPRARIAIPPVSFASVSLSPDTLVAPARRAVVALSYEEALAL
eukprot:3318472-Alexandrium_andersonii.AAC.1